MTTTELIAEGESIARPAFVLGEQPNDGGIVAYWGGIRTDLVFRRRHVCTVSETLLARLDIVFARPTGPISVFEFEQPDGNWLHRAEGDGRLRFAEMSFENAVPLYATAIRSFPPFAALCNHGSERIGRWLAERGFARHDYWRADTEANEGYDEEWQRRSPFYQVNAAVVVGGWHFLWPEDDFYMPPECRLLFMTQREAEPWVEVWHGAAGGGLRARERHT